MQLAEFKDTDIDLPEMKLVRQMYQVPPAVDIPAAVQKEWDRLDKTSILTAGMRIAVGVGSRGVANLAAVVREVVARLKSAGCKPFITPAMGSHGGATPEGQIEVLRARGVCEERVGAPVEATMDAVPMGETDGISLFVDRLAHEADGIVLINRVKPHTNFFGKTESGLVKMMAIGLGNQVGAEHYHRLTMERGYYDVISTAGTELIKRCRVLFGVGLVENQHHETCDLKMALAEDIVSIETALLKSARQYLPTLPLDKIDLLVVDELGKDISGEGIDPNVVGRDVCTCGARRSSPKITRIFVRDLTKASEGAALGIGQADFTVKRLVDKIDFAVTAVNCLTSCCPESGMVPLTFATDKEAVAAALKTIRPYTMRDLRLVHIKNTLDLASLLVSEGCLADLAGRADVTVDPSSLRLNFDRSGNLISLWERETSH